MLARMYKDRQREAQLARENEALIDLRPSMDEVWFSSEPYGAYRTRGPSVWSSMRPLAARILTPFTTPEPPTGAEQPLRELYVGRMPSRTSAMLPPILPRKKSKHRAVDVEIHTTLQMVVLIRMPSAQQSAARSDTIYPSPEEGQLPILDIGTYELPWRTDSLT